MSFLHTGLPSFLGSLKDKDTGDIKPTSETPQEKQYFPRSRTADAGMTHLVLHIPSDFNPLMCLFIFIFLISILFFLIIWDKISQIGDVTCLEKCTHSMPMFMKNHLFWGWENSG